MSTIIISHNLVTDNKVNFFSVQFSGSTQRNLKTNSIDSVRTFELSDFLDHVLVKSKQQAPLFVPVTWINTSDRCIKANVDTVNAMVLDFDKITDDELATIFKQLDGLLYVGYSSFSHKTVEDKNCLRIILPVDRPMTQEEFLVVWKILARILPNLDKSCKDPCRRWFMPSTSGHQKCDYWISTELEDKESEDKYILSVDRFLAYEDRPTTAPTNGTSATQPDGEQAEQPQAEQPQENNEMPPEDDSRYVQQVVRDDHPITCHDHIIRPFSWIIENWDNLPLSNNGRYQCCRPNSRTIGSAFISKTVHPRHLVARFRLTSAPNRTHHDCDRTTHGIALQYENRGSVYRPSIDVPNVIRMLEIMNLDLFRDARTGYDYYDGELFTDNHFTAIQTVLQDLFRMQFNRSVVITAVENFCAKREIDTLKTYLNGLKWDGTPRAEELFIKYLKAEDTEIHRVYARKWLISCVARAMVWGCKVDTMLILKGEQGIRKSSFFKALAGSCELTGNSYFSDEPISDLSGTDGLSKLKLAWIHEWAELSGMSKKDSGELKMFLSKSVDRYRPKYGRKEVVVDRHCVLCGSTNDDQIFMDSTGSRRFWAVECGGVANKDAYNVQELIDNRDQIWAEAVHYYKSGEQWWLTEDEQQQSSEVNSKFDCVSIHEELIENWLCNNQGRTFTFEELSDEIYMETYEMADGTLGKRSKVIKLPTGGKWHKTILTSLGCLQLNNGNTARYKGRVGRFWVAPIENIPEIISVSQENYEVEFNADSTVKRVRKFGQEWVLLEDMSQEVREDWMKRYPKHEAKVRNFPDKQERMFR